VPFTTTSATKQAIIQSLQSAFENGLIFFFKTTLCLLGSYYLLKSTPRAVWFVQIFSAVRMHDDCVMSLAIAWSGMHEKRVNITRTLLIRIY
jgi:hypothetical protein